MDKTREDLARENEQLKAQIERLNAERINRAEAAQIAAAIAAEMQRHFVVEPTLTLAEAAKGIGISVSVMRQLCRERRIPAIRLDKSYRIRVIDLNNYLAAHLQAATKQD